MKTKRVLRDGAILLAFCGVFYLLTLGVNYLGQERVKLASMSEFSNDRREADRLFEQNNYEAAIPHLVALTENDPFNSHAFFYLGKCYASLYHQKKSPSLSNLNPMSDANLELCKEYAEKAAEALQVAVDFPRYRGLAHRNLAMIYAQEGQKELAITHIREAAESNGFPRSNGLRVYGVFEPLYETEEFKEIERTYFRRWLWSNRNKIGNRRRRSIGVASPKPTTSQQSEKASEQ